MYTTCLRCERALGSNRDLPHLRVGRRVAFDTSSGRLWVVCTSCGQWNLVPIERRWEALADCDRLARRAESRVSGETLGMARTDSGLELLRVGGLTDEDIANWRYGRRIRSRQRTASATLVVLGVLAAAIGTAAGHAFGAPVFGAWMAGLLGFWLLSAWQRPPRLWKRLADGAGGHYLLWPWQVGDVHFAPVPPGTQPVLVVPHARGTAQLRGERAAAVLAALLPTLNGADCAGVSLRRVLLDVEKAEKTSRRPIQPPGRRARRKARLAGRTPTVRAPLRPWEVLATRYGAMHVAATAPAWRLALEMAATEEHERAGLRARVEALGEEWREEELVGRIADDLLLPEPVIEKLEELKESPERGGRGSA